MSQQIHKTKQEREQKVAKTQKKIAVPTLIFVIVVL